MAKAGGIARAAVIPRMKYAIKSGLSASAFIKKMSEAGLSYRRTDMLADWRSMGNIEKKTGLLRYVRKDRIPSPGLYAGVTWQLSKEFLYKLKVQSRVRPGEPITEQFVNITTDRAMTPGELEQEAYSRWAGWYPERREQIIAVVPELAVRKIAQ